MDMNEYTVYSYSSSSFTSRNFMLKFSCCLEYYNTTCIKLLRRQIYFVYKVIVHSVFSENFFNICSTSMCDIRKWTSRSIVCYCVSW